MDIPSSYDFQDREPHWQNYWEDHGVYRWDSEGSHEETYAVDTPPPTVSGSLHMGHVFSYTQADIIIRYQRMQGKNIYYPFGFDDNGLPTERLVEKNEGVRAHDVGREKFRELCLEQSEQAEQVFKELWQSLGLSVDWTENYSTIDEHCRRISQWSFLDLFQKGHVYRQAAPTLYDPEDRTALAQAEVEDDERESTFNDITFGVRGSDETLTIATTRPELIPACVAVFYHPGDDRYAHLEGEKAVTPLFNVEVPITPDRRVDPDKGTGIVMCCTFGDTTDIEWWHAYDLPLRQVIDRQGEFVGTLGFGTDAYPTQSPERAESFYEQLAGKTVEEARETIVEILDDEGLLEGREDIVHTISVAERSGAPLEILVTDQWFIRLLDKKEELLEYGERIDWHPDHMFNRYRDWVENLQWDWCISRQRYYGVPFPVWYEKDSGDVILPNVQGPEDAEDKLPVNPLEDLPPGYSEDQVRPEDDVFDTWATSSLTPNIVASGLTGELALDPDRFERIYPMDLRPQAHEIIRTWLFYTVTKSYLHAETLPWDNAMISGWCLDEEHRKMSKSLGNVVTPEEEVEEYGADAIRYWTATSTLGRDTAYDPDLLEEGKKLITKLFNATKFAMGHLEDLNVARRDTPKALARDRVISEPVDRWLLARLNRTIESATRFYDSYEYAKALSVTEDFFWDDFCDNYLEICKGRVYAESDELDPSDFVGDQPRRSAQWTLFHALHTVLRLFAPVTSHFCEEAYHWYFADLDNATSIHNQDWPQAKHYPADEDLLDTGAAMLEVITAVRKFKSDSQVSLAKPLEVLKVRPEGSKYAGVTEELDALRFDLKSVTGAEELILTEDGDLSADAFESEQGNFLIQAELAD